MSVMVGGAAGPHMRLAVARAGRHATLAADEPEPRRNLQRLAGREVRLGIEDLYSGPGLQRLYGACSPAEAPLPPEPIVERAAGRVAGAHGALGIFPTQPGGVAGDLALTFNARRSVYLAGGVLQGLAAQHWESRFRAVSVHQGAWSTYFENIPTWLVTDPFAALHGLAFTGDR
ncbi:MAG: glucokinase [Gammaproteobacteria bacterium]|nr:glucokinase [Gammaproteobacteria bacterium]